VVGFVIIGLSVLSFAVEQFSQLKAFSWLSRYRKGNSSSHSGDTASCMQVELANMGAVRDGVVK